jgi:hypothetical protein
LHPFARPHIDALNFKLFAISARANKLPIHPRSICRPNDRS